VRLADPVPNVELRADRHGHQLVVLAFPYRADIVDAARQIPGRRFDWDSKEWSAPQSDVTAPYVKGILERFTELLPSPEVSAWLGEAVSALSAAHSATPVTIPVPNERRGLTVFQPPQPPPPQPPPPHPPPPHEGVRRGAALPQPPPGSQPPPEEAGGAVGGRDP